MQESEYLYHYTKVGNAHSILTSGCFWATDYRYLNDKNELKSSLNTFLNLLDDEQKEVIKFSIKYMNKIRSHFVISFSGSPTVLSQWRSYADDGSGLSLGFKRNMLSYSGAKSSLSECVYLNHEEFIRSVVASNLELIDRIVSLKNSLS